MYRRCTLPVVGTKTGFKELVEATGLTYRVLAGTLTISVGALKSYASGRRKVPDLVYDKVEALVKNRGKNFPGGVQDLEGGVQNPGGVQEIGVPGGDSGVQNPKSVQKVYKECVQGDTGEPLTPAYCEKFGYKVGSPLTWDQIVEIFESSRRLGVLKAEVRKNLPLADMGVAIPTGEADHPEFDILEDGYARGFRGDTLAMRAEKRTAHAIRRFAERRAGGINAGTALAVEWCMRWAQIWGAPLAERMAFLRKVSK